MSNDISDESDDSRAKMAAIFREFLGERSNLPSEGMPLVRSLQPILEREFSSDIAHDIAFHLADWIEDAAFLVALHFFPERFTPAEIANGVEAFLTHAPEHVGAAAALSGHPIQDVFGVTSPSSTKTKG